MKKVLFVITKSNWGGVQRYVFDLATHLPKDEFAVAVALGGTGARGAATGELASKLSSAGVRTIVVRNFMRDVSLGKEVQTFFELVRLFKNERPDVVHLNSSKAITLGALAARVAGVPNIVSTVHGWAFNEVRPYWQKLLIKILHWLGVLLAHKTIVVSQFDKTQARRWPFVRNKIICIHNGIEPLALGSGDAIRAAFPPGAHITGTVGELTKNKNQVSLIEQAQKDQQMYVAIVGEGELRGWLEQKIKAYGLENRVKFFGFMPAAEVLKGFDIFALPSLKEGLPYVLLEAKMAGLPIVANRVGGVSEILDAKDMREFTLEHMVEKTTKLYRS